MQKRTGSTGYPERDRHIRQAEQEDGTQIGRTGQANRTCRTGKEECERQNKKADTTSIIGQTERERQTRTGRMGHADWDRQNRTDRTRKEERDRQNRTGRQGMQNSIGRTRHVEQDRQ